MKFILNLAAIVIVGIILGNIVFPSAAKSYLATSKAESKDNSKSKSKADKRFSRELDDGWTEFLDDCKSHWKCKSTFPGSELTMCESIPDKSTDQKESWINLSVTVDESVGEQTLQLYPDKTYELLDDKDDEDCTN